MNTEPPIACKLSASELPGRLQEIRDLGRAALVDIRTEARRAQLRFTAAPGIRARVDALVAAESQCCPFLEMRVTEEPAVIVLTVDAPEGGDVAAALLIRSGTSVGFCTHVVHEPTFTFRGRACPGERRILHRSGA